MTLKIEKYNSNYYSIKPLRINSGDVPGIIDEIKGFISLENCSSLVLDLSDMNMLNSVRIGVLSATQHFVKYPKGKMQLIVSSKEAMKSIKSLKLSNTMLKYEETKLELQQIA